MIRPERAHDHDAVRALNVSAFGSPGEARLVDRLRREADPVISLVAEDDGVMVGHIMFTPVTLPDHPHLRAMGLGPMAVVSTHRRQGVGSALVRSGLERCKQMGFGAAVVLGHPDYYPRFGFRPAATHGLACEFAAPAEAFMAVELQPNYLAAASGIVSYHAAFADV